MRLGLNIRLQYALVNAPVGDGPTITSLSIEQGKATDTVIITGTNLTSATCEFGGTSATVNSTSSTTVNVTAPTHAAGSVDVVVTTSGGTATSHNGFTYIAAPTITSLDVLQGKAGDTVVITGTYLTSATCTFGGVSATVNSTSATTVNLTVPAHAAGAVDVVVTTLGGSATSSGAYTYIAAPTISAISPDIGNIAGGVAVTVTGTNLTTATGVTIGGSACTGFTAVNSTTATALTPSRTKVLVGEDVVITTAGGTATLSGGTATTGYVSWDPEAHWGSTLKYLGLSGTGYVYNANCEATGTSPPGATLASGDSGLYDIKAVVNTTGSRGSGLTIDISINGGSTYPQTNVSVPANGIVTITGTGSKTITIGAGSASADNVWRSTIKTWTDQSVNSPNSPTNTTQTANPYLSLASSPSGKTGLVFDGTNDVLTFASNITTSPFSAICALTTTDTSTSRAAFGTQKLRVWSHHTTPVKWGIYGSATLSSAQLLTSTPAIIEVVSRTATDNDLRTNGNNKISGSASSYGALSATVGAVSTAFHKGVIYDLIIIGEAASDANIALCRRWLGARETITVATS
jgi:hypothetical protein